ncbi:hydroxymethylpyrimidine/phosphomethylpyrimidine kinase [Spirochaetia bacterium]|nr:hydroxymethylpyrimidine/phosphomethylpyrimidine kinase [Spirochaetia bacterium]
MKNVLSIAGSDPSGGAGIQADLKTMCALGVYGMTVITAVTVQNTQAVYDVQEIRPDIVRDQIRAVFDDIRVDAVKVGMVSGIKIIDVIRNELLRLGAVNIVIDPVMVSKSGYALLQKEAEAAVRELTATADIVTPNIPEAEILSGIPVKTEDDMKKAAESIARNGAKNVLIKGGHRFENDATDLLWMEKSNLFLSTQRIETKNTHGTGCTLSSAIASFLALGKNMEEAVRAAKEYITKAISNSYNVGKGVGPVGHLADLYKRAGLSLG